MNRACTSMFIVVPICMCDPVKSAYVRVLNPHPPQKPQRALSYFRIIPPSDKPNRQASQFCGSRWSFLAFAHTVHK